MQEKISIIVPVYKVEQYLDKCVKSIINQTYKNLEILLVDDGSPDSCPKMCDEWAKKDERIKVIHKQNGGLSDARNAAIDVATGKYIMFVDSDDYLDENICTILYDLIKKYNATFSMCDAKDIQENKPEIITEASVEEIKETVFEGEEILPLMLKNNIKYFMTAWAKLYKKDLFKTLRYDVGKIHEDEFILHKLLINTKKIVHINKQMYFYLQRSGSITQTKAEKSYSDILEAFENRFEFLLNNTKYQKQTIRYAVNFCRRRYTQIKKAKLSKELAKKYFETYKKYYNMLEN